MVKIGPVHKPHRIKDACSRCSTSKANVIAEQHISLDGSPLTEEQRFDAELQHVENSIRAEVPVIGEILLKLSGSRSVVTGDLTAEQLATAIERIKAVADEVC